MSGRNTYFVYYTEASIVCVILFAIMLGRDLFSVDRQEKQIKYDHALIAFMLYFISDAMWAAIIAGMLPRNRFTVVSANLANCTLMSAITYTWLKYVMAVEHVSNRDKPFHRFAFLAPFVVSTAVVIALYLFAPDVLLTDALESKPIYNAFLISVPCVYIVAVITYTLRRAVSVENPIERRRHLSIGFFPLMVIAGGLVQILLLPDTPIFCFCCAILMIVFYINSLDTQISTDPLTSLNNRGQLLHCTMQRPNMYREGRLTFVIMFDINDFKLINDTYGHAEGDRALVLVADSLRNVMKNHNTPMFVARYGGDEFILVVHPVDEAEVPQLIDEIRGQIEVQCHAAQTPYLLSTGAGYDRLMGGDDTFLKCMQRADEKLYLDKAHQKEHRRAALH